MYNGLAHTGTGALILTGVALAMAGVGALLRFVGIRRG